MKDCELGRAECCNYNGIGCDGIDARSFPTWLPEGMKPRARCIEAKGKRCEFFRLANRVALCETCHQNPAVRVAGAAIAKQHQARRAREECLKAGDRVCADCGEPRNKGHRYCQECRTKRAHWNHNRKMVKYMKKYRNAKLQPVIPFCG